MSRHPVFVVCVFVGVFLSELTCCCDASAVIMTGVLGLIPPGTVFQGYCSVIFSLIFVSHSCDQVIAVFKTVSNLRVPKKRS